MRSYSVIIILVTAVLVVTILFTSVVPMNMALPLKPRLWKKASLAALFVTSTMLFTATCTSGSSCLLTTLAAPPPTTKPRLLRTFSTSFMHMVSPAKMSWPSFSVKSAKGMDIYIYIYIGHVIVMMIANAFIDSWLIVMSKVFAPTASTM